VASGFGIGKVMFDVVFLDRLVEVHFDQLQYESTVQEPVFPLGSLETDTTFGVLSV
jgi:hypothetical protein